MKPENVQIKIQFPNEVIGVALMPSSGSFNHKESNNTGIWQVSKLPDDSQNVVTLEGRLRLANTFPKTEETLQNNLTASVSCKLSDYSLTGTRI